MNGRLAILPFALVGLLALAACTSTTPGTGATTLPPSSQQPATSSSAAPSGSALASIQPCDLLTSGEISKNGLTGQEESNDSGARSCTWDNDAFDNGLGYTVGDDIRDTQGLADINTDGYSVSDDPVGSHQGKLAQQTNGDGCFVAIGVGTSARVDVVVSTASADVQQSCALANRYAKLIEPKLP